MKIGILGAGHMGGAMIKGWLRSKQVQPENILVKGGKSGTAEALQAELGFELTQDINDFAKVDVIFLAVGTPLIMPMIEQLKEILIKTNMPLVSVSAGVSIQEMQEVLGEEYPIAHAIPNTPAQINQGITGISFAEKINSDDKKLITTAFEYLGTMMEISESKIGIFGTLAGCGPAFVDIFLDALADGAVLHGLDRETAQTVAAHMVSSAANLMLETGKHPGVLKDEVASPGGTTIKGITALEKEGFRYATINALDTIMKS